MNMLNSFQKQKHFFDSGITLSEEFRREHLLRLKDSIKAHESEIYAALKKDLNKSEFECYETEIGIVYDEISYMLKHLHHLMRARKVPTPLAHFPSKSTIFSEPYGQVLIMAPWNYPLQLALAPLAGSIAAGNCAVIKPSDYSRETSAVISKIIRAAFPPEYITVAEGGREMNSELLDLPFDYIFFTGGVTVGKHVMEKASQHLTPVTLELGGKSPCIVDDTADIRLTARRIVWGKLLNAGQTCVAPDYVLVHENVKDRLVSQMKKYIEAFYGKEPQSHPDYPKIINRKHFERLSALLDAGNIISGGDRNSDTLQIAPAIIDADWNSEIMKDEIFGPLLPVITFKTIDEATEKIKARPKPLALYLFTTSDANKKFITRNISYGGGCINDTIVHLASSHLPFGGVGNSGMGSYHGKQSFVTFSHEKSVLEKSNRLDLPVRYVPGNKAYLKIMQLLMK